jgi:hypothetical protein
MSVPVSDSRSNRNDQIAHAVHVLGRSKARIAIFKAIYRGKKRRKTINESMRVTRVPYKTVLNETKRLADQDIVRQERDGENDLAYSKDPFYAANKAEILRQVADPKRRKKFPTKYNSGRQAFTVINNLRVAAKATSINIDDIDSFTRVREIDSDRPYTKMPEATFKNGVKRILGERGEFRDWGGERNDLFTTRLRVGGRRRSAVFTFKGPGLAGKLTLANYGKNADQLPRLFSSDAEVFIVQHWQQIDQAVFEQLKMNADYKAAQTGKRIYYGIIDGQDSTRLIEAYPAAFRGRKSKQRRRK